MRPRELKPYLAALTPHSCPHSVQIKLSVYMHRYGVVVIKRLYGSYSEDYAREMAHNFCLKSILKHYFVPSLLRCPCEKRLSHFITCIDNHCKTEYRKLRKMPPMSNVDVDTVVDFYVADKNLRSTPMDRQSRIKIFNDLLSILTDRESEAYRYRDLKKKSIIETASRMGIGTDRVKKLTYSAREKLKKYCEGRDWFQGFPPNFIDDIFDA